MHQRRQVSGIPITPLDQDDVKVKSESDGAGEEKAVGDDVPPKSPAAKQTISFYTAKCDKFIRWLSSRWSDDMDVTL